MTRNSIASSSRPDARLLLALVALAGVVFFLIMSAITYRIGFPLDDAWIHLVYARNLAEHGEWAFRLGEHSAGSTAPLWTVLLAIGFLIRLAPYVWTFFLGWLALTSIAILAETTARRFVKSYQPRFPWVGSFLALEWHLTWSATSGMETLLHGLLAMTVLVALMMRSRRYLTLGLLAGLSVWVRPDGLTLLGPIVFTALFQEDSFSSRLRAIVNLLIGFGALFLPYLAFNLYLSGSPMPNTFYAKQAEYEAYWLSKSLTERLTGYILPILASPFIALLPGMFLWMREGIRQRNWGALAGVIWFLGYIGIYFMRLPAYQHGRYIIPALPVLYLWGMLGLISYLTSPRAHPRISLMWKTTVILLTLSFQFIGARQNALDVVWIETQMVRTANWVNQNLPAHTVLAVHDIGAIGYYTQNPLIDLAGLLTPDVVPFIRNEERLEAYLNASPAEYLITFPGLYPQLTAQRKPIFEAGIEQFPFDENMHVYRWK